MNESSEADDNSKLAASWDRLNAVSAAEGEEKAVSAGEDRRRRIIAAFDPMTRAFWSIPMALAWISSRSVDDVRNQWDEFRTEVGDSPSSWDDIELAEAFDAVTGEPPRLWPIEKAWRELRSALEDERLNATGFRSGEDVEMPISAGLWQGMAVATDRVVGFLCVPLRPDREFELVRVRAAELLTLFPQQPNIENAAEVPGPQPVWPVATGLEGSLDNATAPRSHSRRGRLSKYDWLTYDRMYRERIVKDGAPDELNDDGWRTQADVTRWLQKLAAAENPSIDMNYDSAKKRARMLMGNK